MLFSKSIYVPRVTVLDVLNTTVWGLSCRNSSNSSPNNAAARRLLLDGDNKTCLQAFSDGARFLRLISNVYVSPYDKPNGLIFNIYVSDLSCNDPAMLVYHHEGTGICKTIKRQCKYQHGPQSMSGTTNLCSYVCLRKDPLDRKTALFIEIEMMPWETRITLQPEVCEVNSQNLN